MVCPPLDNGAAHDNVTVPDAVGTPNVAVVATIAESVCGADATVPGVAMAIAP